MIPSFAVDRTEVILLTLRRLVAEKRIPSLPVYADSPMALEVLRVYRRAMASGDPEIRPGRFVDGDPFDPVRCTSCGPRGVPPAQRHRVPVDHHLRLRHGDGRAGPPPPAAMPSRQPVCGRAPGVPGRRDPGSFARGRRHHDQVARPVRAGPCRSGGRRRLFGACRRRRGSRLVAPVPACPDTAYIVHGEPRASAVLADRVHDELGWHAVVPVAGEHVRLD